MINMPISKDEILTKLNKFFPNSKVIVEDLKGDGDHYSATIVSDKRWERRRRNRVVAPEELITEEESIAIWLPYLRLSFFY